MGMILSEFKKRVEEFLIYLEVEKNVSAHTLRAYKGDFVQLMVFWEEIDKQELRISHDLDSVMKRYIHMLFFKKITKTTLARKISSVRSLIAYLKKQGIKVFAHFKSPRLDRRLPSILTVDEIFYLLDGVKNEELPTRFPYRDKAVFEFLYATGVRCAELVGIRMQDIDFANKSILVTGKGKKDRIVLFGEKAKKVVESYLKEERSFVVREKDDGYLFLNYAGGKLTSRSVQRICAMFREFLKIDRKLTPHKVRHSFATHMLNQGVDLRVVQELLGHKMLATTEIYTQVSSSELAKMCDEKHPLNDMGHLVGKK